MALPLCLFIRRDYLFITKLEMTERMDFIPGNEFLIPQDFIKVCEFSKTT